MESLGVPPAETRRSRAEATSDLSFMRQQLLSSSSTGSGMAVYTVSPGSAPDTQAARKAGWAMKWLMIPMVKIIPGMSQTPETAARRYHQASEFGTDVSGQFFASAPRKLTGPMEAMRHPHLLDPANQEAAWQAVVRVSGVDLSSAAP